MIPADNDTPMGPGFFIFFQTKHGYHSWKDDGLGKREREENEILILLTAMYESGTFN